MTYPINITDQTQLKSLLLDLLQQRPELVKEAIVEYTTRVPDEAETSEARRERMRRLIQLDFDQYEEVFKALA